jgi:hypothetical protein
MDVVHALRRHGRTLYGFGAWLIHFMSYINTLLYFQYSFINMIFNKGIS